MTILDDIDFGNLSDPEETPQERKEFVSRVVDNKLIMDEILTRMLREIGRRYFGHAKGVDDIAVANGAIQFAELIREQIGYMEAEHLQQITPEEEKEPNIVNSGSELGL